MWRGALRGYPGVRPITMLRERCRVATVTGAAAGGDPQPLVTLFADALMRAIGRDGSVLLKADRVLCNGLNVAAYPFALGTPLALLQTPNHERHPDTFRSIVFLSADRKQW